MEPRQAHLLMAWNLDSVLSAATILVVRLTLVPGDRTKPITVIGVTTFIVESGAVAMRAESRFVKEGRQIDRPRVTVAVDKGERVLIPAGSTASLQAMGCRPAKVLFVLVVPATPLPAR